MAIKKMLNFLFHMDFFEHQKPVTKQLYLLYTLMSGICYESYVRQWFRYFISIYFITALLFVQACCLVTLLKYKTMDISVSVYSATLLVGTPHILLIIICGYYWRENLHKSFEIINEYSRSHENYDKGIVPEDGNNYTIIDYNKYFKYKFAVPLMLLITFCFCIKPIAAFVTLETSSDISPLYNYNYPMPFLTHINWLAYFLIYLLHTVVLISFALINSINSSIHLLFSIIIRNQVVLLTKEIKFESNFITKSLDNFYEQERKILEAETCPINVNLKLDKISKERKLCYDRLANHTKKWIFRHQKLFTAMYLLKGYFEAILTINLLWNTILCTSFGYISVMTLGTKSIEHIFYIMMVIPCIFACCMSGHLHDSMMDELEKEIYSLPWYYLPSTHRKLILNFLSIVQRQCTIKFFKAYPIMLSLYPTILMKIFSYLQIIRVMETKIQN